MRQFLSRPLLVGASLAVSVIVVEVALLELIRANGAEAILMPQAMANVDKMSTERRT